MTRKQELESCGRVTGHSYKARIKVTRAPEVGLCEMDNLLVRSGEVLAAAPRIIDVNGYVTPCVFVQSQVRKPVDYTRRDRVN
jgi:hypothetical protein